LFRLQHLEYACTAAIFKLRHDKSLLPQFLSVFSRVSELFRHLEFSTARFEPYVTKDERLLEDGSSVENYAKKSVKKRKKKHCIVV